MARWTALINVEVKKLEPHGPMQPDGSQPTYVSESMSYLCGGDQHGDTPAGAIGEAIEKLEAHLQKLAGSDPRKGN